MNALACTGLVLSLLPSAVLAQALETPGRIEAVTVYRGQALVTRVVDVAGAAGAVQEVIVTDLPPRIRPESLHAEASPGVKVRSVLFRQRPVLQDTREEVRAIDARIESLKDEQVAAKREADLIVEHRKLLEGLQQFVAPTAAVELTQGVLNAETLEKLAGFIRGQRAAMAEDELKLAVEGRRLGKELEQASRERAELAAASSRTAYEAVVLVAREGRGEGGLRLRYLVDGATWSPSYNVRTAAGAEREGTMPVTLEYYASIQQMSGEDWGDVAMTLSTATPSLIARAPKLDPLTLTLTGAEAQQMGLGYREVRKELADKQREVESRRAQFATAAKGKGPRTVETDGTLDMELNRFAGSIQVLDLLAGERVQGRGLAAGAGEEGLAVTYTIASPTTLPSRSDRQMIQIAAIPLRGDFAKIATPVLTGYVYDEARAVNSSSMVLLAGPVTAYANGAFVGSGELPTVAAGQTLTSGFGIDSSLHSSRELVNRTETVQGGNRVVELTYRLSVENFGAGPARVRLLDRIPGVPGAGQPSDIRVSLLSTSVEPASEGDAAAQRRDGILRWDLAVPAQATGAAAATVEYTFRLEFDRQMTLTGLGW